MLGLTQGPTNPKPKTQNMVMITGTTIATTNIMISSTNRRPPHLPGAPAVGPCTRRQHGPARRRVPGGGQLRG